MAGSITVTPSDVGGGVTKYSIAWTSDASGNVSGTSFDMKRGGIGQVKFVPGAGGVQPSSAYDLTLIDSDSVDLLAGTGADLSNSVSTRTVPVIGTGNMLVYFEGGAVTPSISNAGNAKQGTFVLLVGN